MTDIKKNNVLVIAPHPDDESLGCGGTLLRHLAEDDSVHWLIITGMTADYGYSSAAINTRDYEIQSVAKKYSFTSTVELSLPPAKLDTLPFEEIIEPVSTIINKIQPNVVYTAYRNDAHTDHKIVFDAVMAATKSFRFPFVKRVLAYETISETDFGCKPEDGGFRPNVFINITEYLTKKLDILNTFKSEMGEFPFPRSPEAVEALAKVRGVQCGALAAEAFMLIKEIL